ncbi:CHAP domain-containing protein [Enterococcus xiangfangensis]|uniref:CHAP domain-containing protein n=1 Tax=Enterococcus xiangfangensis TaxID=1296537 RepID=A0ABU3FCQ2_9ENTE|nr:CHAP domain-containing protein [Enterococcus xiangfangensis]MDT2760452.1 CHAP domain-containing protein [Enterococcus xiangfangensis]
MKKSIISALLVCTFAVSAVPSIALADNYDQQIQEKDQKISDLQGKQSDVQIQIDELTNEIAAVSGKVKDLEAKQDQLNKDTMKLQDKIAVLKVRIAKRNETIKNQARDTQVKGQATNYVSAVLEADSLSDVIGRVQAMSTIVKANKSLMEQQKADEAAVEAKVKDNETKVAEIQANQKELEAQKNTIANKQAELNVVKANYAAEQATAEQDKAKLKKQQEAAKAEQARILKQQQAAEKARKAEEARQAKEAAKAQKAFEESQAKAEKEQAEQAQAAAESSTSEETSASEASSTSSSTESSSTGSSSTEKISTPTPTPTPSTGGKVDHTGSGNMYAVGQCTWYVKTVAPWAGTYWGNGCQWGASAAADGFQVDGTPAAGSIVVFAQGQSVGTWNADPSYGHVAYVQSYNASNNTITITQGGMGFPTPTGPNTATLSASGLQYIHP